MGLDVDNLCRFCESAEETNDHLLYECPKFKELDESYTFKLGEKAKMIVNEIYKLED